MSNKNYPYPEGLEKREIKRKNQISERLKRMTDRESEEWNHEAYRLAMIKVQDERVKPTYPVLAGIIKLMSIDCDVLFNAILLGENGTDTAKPE